MTRSVVLGFTMGNVTFGNKIRTRIANDHETSRRFYANKAFFGSPNPCLVFQISAPFLQFLDNLGLAPAYITIVFLKGLWCSTGRALLDVLNCPNHRHLYEDQHNERATYEAEAGNPVPRRYQLQYRKAKNGESIMQQQLPQLHQKDHHRSRRRFDVDAWHQWDEDLRSANA